jgi:hypothetical protein
VDLTGKHVVVDANQLGDKGHVNPKSLKFLARALSIEGRELWIPEPVLWEWGEHMIDDLVSASGGARTALRVLAPGAAALFERSKESLASDVIERLSEIENVHVLVPPESAWRHGVRDQVLAIGAGRRKADIKTGAADTVSVHAVHHHEPDAGNYVVHGADADWAKVYVVNKWQEPVFVSDFKSLFLTKPGDVDAAFAQLKMTAQLEGLSVALSRLDAGTYLKGNGYPEIGEAELEISVDEVLSVEDVDEVPESSLFFARVTFEGVAEAVVQIWDPFDERWSTAATGGYQVTGTVDVAFLDGEPDLSTDGSSRWEILSELDLKDADGEDLEMWL